MREHHRRTASKCAAGLLAAALMTSATARGQVDLTPVESTYELDGVKLSNIAFRDGRQEIRYSPPGDWRLSGSGPRLNLVPTEFSDANGNIEVKAIGGPIPFDEASVKKYAEAAKLALPREARGVEALGTRLNPLKICGHDTLAVDLRYELFGATYRAQLLYLNREREQWVFRFTAPANTFDRAFEPFRASLYSLTGL